MWGISKKGIGLVGTIIMNYLSYNNGTIFHTLDINNGEQDTKKTKETKKKFIFKTEQDRLYEEAIKYFGKLHVKYRDKASVVEEYLEEEGSMWKK